MAANKPLLSLAMGLMIYRLKSTALAWGCLLINQRYIRNQEALTTVRMPLRSI